MMTNQEIAELKKVVQLRIDCLLVMIDGNAKSADPKQRQQGQQDSNNMFDPETAAVEDSGIEEHAIEQAQQELTQLTRALSWLETDEAGKCEQCGCTISFNRLKTVPTTRICSKCAEQKK